MLVDRAVRCTFRNFSTLFLIVAVVTVPLHLAYSTVFKNVIAVSELHAAIEAFPSERQVRSVGRAELASWRSAGIAIAVLEVALLPLLAIATRRAIDVDRAGGIPTVVDAYGQIRRAGRTALPHPARRDLGGLAVVALIALATGVLARAAGSIVIEPLGDDSAFLGVAVIEATARAAAAPLFLTALAFTAGPAKADSPETPSLY